MYLSQFEFFGTDTNGKLSSFLTHKDLHPSYTHVVSGGFGAGKTSDLFCYDAVLGEGDVYTLNDQGQVAWIQHYPTLLRRGCTQVVVGHLGSSGYHDLLFYEPVAGVVDIYQVNAPGRLYLIKNVTGVSKTWTNIIAANFGSNGSSSGGWSDLFFYDAAAGLGEFYTTDGLGALNRVTSYPSLRKGCTQVVAGNFGGDGYSDLAFYSPTDGVVDFYTVGKLGVLILQKTQTGLSKTWSQLVAGNFARDAWSDLLSYDSASGTAEVYATDGRGGVQRLAINTGLSKAWTQVLTGLVKGRFGTGTSGNDHVLAYNQTVGRGIKVPAQPPSVPATVTVVEPRPTPTPATPAVPAQAAGSLHLYDLNGFALTPVKQFSDLSSSWTHVVPSPYGLTSGLLFYDSNTGVNEYRAVYDDGTMRTIGSLATLPAGCTLIEYGLYGPGRTSGFMFYEAAAGRVHFYGLDSNKCPVLFKTLEGMGTTWTHIFYYYFKCGGLFDMLFYDAATGEARFYTSDGNANLTAVTGYAPNSGWHKSWSQIVPGTFDYEGGGDLFLYDASAGLAQFMSAKQGETKLIREQTALSKTWSQIHNIQLNDDYCSNLLFCDSSAGMLQVCRTTADGTMTVAATFKDLPSSWTHTYLRRADSPGHSGRLFCYRGK